MKLLYSKNTQYRTRSKAAALNFDENSDKVKRFNFTAKSKAIAFELQ